MGTGVCLCTISNNPRRGEWSELKARMGLPSASTSARCSRRPRRRETGRPQSRTSAAVEASNRPSSSSWLKIPVNGRSCSTRLLLTKQAQNHGTARPRSDPT